MRPSQDGHALNRQGHKGGLVSGAPVPGVVNVHQGITPGGSPQVLSVKELRNTEKKDNKSPYSGRRVGQRDGDDWINALN